MNDPAQVAPGDPDTPTRLTAWVRGRVQGVGFRWWARSRSLELGLVGTATNLEDGRVEIVAEGARARLEALVELLTEEPPRQPPPGAPRSYYARPGSITGVTLRWSPAEGGYDGFRER